ncbi:hypothetical protein EBR43_05280 [bacterium]|nr:hypothetical protein [bacterium]NBW57190.1 hypothetical protein [bacterium]NBX72141.1 hypothetical protein [bacterium]
MNNPLNMPSFLRTYWLPFAFFSAWVVFTITMPGAILGFTGWQTLGLTGWGHAGIALLTQMGLGVFQAVAEYALHHYPDNPTFEDADVQLELQSYSEQIQAEIRQSETKQEEFLAHCKTKFAQRNEILARNSLFAGVFNTVVAAMGWLMTFHLGKIIQYTSYAIAFTGWPTFARYLPSIFQGVSALAGVGVWWSIRSNKNAAIDENQSTYLQRWANGLKAIDAVYFAISFASGASFGSLMRSTFSIGTLSARWMGVLKVVRPDVLAARSVSLITLQGVYVTLLNSFYHTVRGLLPFEKLPFIGTVLESKRSSFVPGHICHQQGDSAAKITEHFMQSRLPSQVRSSQPIVEESKESHEQEKGLRL